MYKVTDKYKINDNRVADEVQRIMDRLNNDEVGEFIHDLIALRGAPVQCRTIDYIVHTLIPSI